jgi:hypothetical protein
MSDLPALPINPGKLTGELAEHAQTDQHKVESVVEILLAV